MDKHLIIKHEKAAQAAALSILIIGDENIGRMVAHELARANDIDVIVVGNVKEDIESILPAPIEFNTKEVKELLKVMNDVDQTKLIGFGTGYDKNSRRAECKKGWKGYKGRR